MKGILKSVWQIGKKNGISLVLFEILYRSAVTAAIWLLANWLIRVLLKRQGFSYLTAENYSRFILHPLTLVCLALMTVLLAFFMLIEISAVFWAVQCSVNDQKVHALAMAKQGIVKGVGFIRRHPFFWPVYILGTLPFLGLHFIIWEIINVRILEFTALQIYKAFPWKWVLFLLCALVLAGSVVISFSLPYCIAEGKRIRTGLKIAAARLKRRAGRYAAGVLAMQGLTLLITAAAYLILSLIVVVVIYIFMKPSARVSGVLVYGAQAQNFVAIFAGSAGIVTGLLSVGAIYFPGRGRRYLKEEDADRFFSKRIPVYLLTAVLVGAEAAVFSYYTFFVGQINNTVLDSFKVTAHRGGALMAPENTMSAVKYAVESMSDYAEIDVQETEDDVLVLLHDSSLKRTTGYNGNIWEMTYQEVAQLDAGVKFNSRFLGEQVPTLDEIIEYSRGKIGLNIEVKNNGHNQNIVSKVVQCLEEHDFVDQCVLTSMNYSFLQQAKELNPDIRTGYIMTMTYGGVSDIEAADFFSVKYTYVTGAFVQEAHSCGKEVHAWTVNYPGDIKRMITYGVDGIITDDPALAHEIYLDEGESQTGFGSLLQYAIK
ncbi:MAG: glycerophosphodiester phosphodiesterase family protein [Ruminococcus sp.]|jgi:glycerophosphoryl diester phosphodiesterase